MTRFVYRHGRRIAVETLNPTPAQAKHQKRLFIQVPLDLVARAAKATDGQRLLVWELILHRCWRERSQTVTATNDMMRVHGISRDVKLRALRQLEEVGLVTVQWRVTKNPIVTVVL
jgi:hypothetical protein